MRRLEGLLAVAYACLIFFLIFSGSYGMLLNPKYLPLTVISGCLLMIYGVHGIIRPMKKANYAGILIFSVFTMLTAGVTCGIGYGQYEQKQAEKREISFEKNYTALNLAELYMILNSSDMKTESADKYVFRGRAYLDSTLTEHGYFGVLRVAMVCCAADTIAAGFRVPIKYLPKGAENGTWVKVYGTAVKVSDDKGKETQLNDRASRTMSGSPIDVSVRDDYVFRPDKIEKTEIPDKGYMYKWRLKPPYNY